jgi:hypothetical protein
MALNNVCAHFNIFFQVNTIMIDAAKEEAEAAIREIFKNAYILMCKHHGVRASII